LSIDGAALAPILPGDAFFASLAVDRGQKAIAVVLSGCDGDGSLGLKAIKAAGSVTFVQCEDTAQFDSMLNTAVATGNVDFVLPPARIAEELANISCNPWLAAPAPVISPNASPFPGDALDTIFNLLKANTDVDFSRYKPTTINRRIQRRMLLYKLEQLEVYAQYLQTHPAEIKALYEEILIHVTSFFRAPEGVIIKWQEGTEGLEELRSKEFVMSRTHHSMTKQSPLNPVSTPPLSLKVWKSG
jgi:two-component system, chemotaxis family, CheB/CheR fusion protein